MKGEVRLLTLAQAMRQRFFSHTVLTLRSIEPLSIVQVQPLSGLESTCDGWISFLVKKMVQFFFFVFF